MLSVHHTGKDADRGMRGSQVLRDRTDAVITLSKAKSGLITATVEKQRNGPIRDQFSFRPTPVLVTVGDSIIKTCTVTDVVRGVPAKAPYAPPAPDAVADIEERSKLPAKFPKGGTQLALEALRSVANGQRTTLNAWRARAYEAFGEREKDAKRQAFNTAKNRLLEESQLISIQDDTVRFLA